MYGEWRVNMGCGNGKCISRFVLGLDRADISVFVTGSAELKHSTLSLVLRRLHRLSGGTSLL